MVHNVWGQYTTKLDAKGRINISSKVRRYLRPEDDDTFLVMRHPSEPCIVAMPISRWEELVEKLETRLDNASQLKRILRRLLYGASEQRIDKQGRLNLTQELIEYGQLNGEVLVFGSKDQLEIWNKDVYEASVLRKPPEKEDERALKEVGL